MASKSQRAKSAIRAGLRDRNAIREEPGDKPREPRWAPCPACSNKAGKKSGCKRVSEFHTLLSADHLPDLIEVTLSLDRSLTER